MNNDFEKNIKKLRIDGVQLTYAEVNEDKTPTVLFIHGNSHAHSSFNLQAESLLLKDYRLVFINLPGHGGSDNLENYSLPLYAQIVASFIEELNLTQVLIVGHSLGGHVALHTLNHITPEGIFIYGTPPLKKPLDFSCFLPNEKARALSQEVCKELDIADLFTELGYEGEQKSLAILNFSKTDPLVRTGILSSVVSDNYSDEAKLLNQYKGKLMVLVSESENLVNNEYITATIEDSLVETQVLAAGHVPHVEKFAEFNEILISFCKNVFTNNVKTKSWVTELEVPL